MAAEKAEAFWILGMRRGEIRQESLPAPGPDEILVQSLYSGVSRGSETLVFEGRVRADQAERIRAPFQAGAFPWPVKYGYANVGRVMEGPEALRGRSVFCLHPHQDRYVVPAAAVTPLPDDLLPERAVLTAYMETAITGLWDGAPGPGDRIAVIGGGALGCLVAGLAGRLPGCAVTLVDRVESRASVAEALEVAFALPESAPGDCDLVFHCSGSEAGLARAIESAGPEARVVEMSWFGSGSVAAPLGGAFHSKRLTLRSSQVSNLPPERRPRWDHARRLALALDLLRDPRYDALITGESRFADLPATLTQLATAPAETLCHRIRYGD